MLKRQPIQPTNWAADLTLLRRRFADQLDTTGLLRLGGISLLVFLGLALRTSYATAPVAVVAALHGATLGGWFLTLGGALTDLLGPTQRVGRSWAIVSMGEQKEGGWNADEPFGWWESHGKPVDPRSLYLHQLQDRLGPEAVQALTIPQQREGRIGV